MRADLEGDMKRARIVFTDPQGRVRLFGSVRRDQSEEEALQHARDYVQRSYTRHEHEQRVVESVRIER